MGPEIIFMIPYVAGLAAVGTIGGTLAIWLVWAGLRRWGPQSLRSASTAFPSGAICSALLCVTLPAGCVWACQPVPQPEGLRTVAAFEAPLPSAADRAAFLALLRRESASEGLKLDAVSDAGLERQTRASANLPVAVRAYIWRGDVRDTEAVIWEPSRDGRVWISFSRGKDPKLAQQFRERVIRRVLERWPETLAIPVAATGALPLREDLVLTAHGYAIEQGKMERYRCPEKPGAKAAAPSAC